jgi:DNA-binding NtrC family response regulator
MATSASVSGTQTGKGKVLIVEDQPAMRELLKIILDGQYHVSEADSGAALHRALEQDQPDVVLLDMVLPDANGLALLPTIKRKWTATEVIVMTGMPTDCGAEAWADEARKGGAFRLVSKSAGFDFQELLGGINLALERRRSNATA